MKILLTGASGFLGSTMLAEWGGYHEIFSLGRDKKSAVVCDLATDISALPAVDLVIHAAGKAHLVPRTTQEKEDFFRVNVQGTINLLTALERGNAPKKMIFISTVAVYGLTQGNNVSESAPLLALDPYGKSKIEAETLVTDWCTRLNIPYYIFRLPLVAGKNAPGNLQAMVKGIRSGRYFRIGEATARKSMILASDLAILINNLTGPSGVYNLTDGYHPSFRELENKIAAYFNKKSPFALPGIAAAMLGWAGDILGRRFPLNSAKLKKITSTLTFDDSSARTCLKWQPRPVLQNWEIE
jgi:nucleoside-diphosphate-sugar epimerase